MKKINLNKLLKSVLLVLLILFTLIKMFKVASAAGMESFSENALDSWLSDYYFPSDFNNFLSQAKSDCEFYIGYKIGNYYYLFLSPYENVFEPRISGNNFYPRGYSISGNFGGSFDNYYLFSSVPTSNYSGFTYSFCWSSTGKAVSAFKREIHSLSGSKSQYGTTVYCLSGMPSTTLYDANYSVFSATSYSNLICYGDMLVNVGNNRLVPESTTIPIYEENNGLKIQKLPSYNGYTLLIDVKDLLQVNLGLTSYDNAALKLIFEYDNFEHDYIIPSYYFDYIVDEGSEESATDSNISFARYRIPSSFFNFPADTRITLTKVDFNIDHTSVGGSQTEAFKIATDFLIQSIDQFAPDPESINKDSETGVDKLTPAQVDNIRYQVKFNDDGELDFDEFYDVNFPDDFTLYYVYMSNLTLQDLISAGVSFDGLYEFVQSTVTSIAGAQSIIENQLKNNNYASYFDVVVFEYIKETSGSLTRTYWYYTTASGRIRTTNTILADCFVGINQIAYNSSVLYDYLYSRLNDFEDQTIKLQYEGNVISGNIRDMLYGVSFSLDNIYNAINNLKFPSSSGSSYSLPDLSQELQRIFVPSMEWEQINYTEYLDSLGVLALPFEFTFDVQQSMLTNYSSSLDLEINEFRVPLGEDELVLFSDQDPFSFSPTSIFPSNLWQIFQYLALFSLVIAEAWFTYCHIFRKEDKE